MERRVCTCSLLLLAELAPSFMFIIISVPTQPLSATHCRPLGFLHRPPQKVSRTRRLTSGRRYCRPVAWTLGSRGCALGQGWQRS